MQETKNNSFHIITFGCTYNSADSDKMKRILINSGYYEDQLSKARILILNTCAVKLPTEQKILELIKKYSLSMQKQIIQSNKESNPLIEEHGLEDRLLSPEKTPSHANILIIAGCLPFISPTMVETIKNILPTRSGILSPHALSQIVLLIEKIENNEEKVLITDEKTTTKEAIVPYIEPDRCNAAIQIAEGCSGNCAYCCTKNARGKLCSFSISSIISSITNLYNFGIREFYITAQDLGAYHYEGKKLHHLLQEILSRPNKFYLRLGMMNPEYLRTHVDEIIEILKDKRVYRFIHIPIQSGSDSVLKIMRRKYTVKEFSYIVEKLRKFDPEISISTDIICGFSGETGEDWLQTVELIRNLKPAVLNISKYTVRPDTEAKKMVQLPSKEIKNRSTEISMLYDKLAQNIGLNQIGREYEVFVSEKNAEIADNFTARNLYYHSIVLKNVELGKRYLVKIIDYKYHYYFAEVISELKE